MSNELIPYSDIEKMGKSIAGSGLFGVKTAEQAVALMLVAQALGKHPAIAAMEYNIIAGRPAKKSEAMLADFQAAGGKVQWKTLSDIKVEAIFSHPQGGEAQIDWDIDRAKKAGLYEKDGSMYKKYPRSMLRARVIAEGVRTVYPAATGGMRAVEEFDDTPEQEHQVDTKKSRLDNIIEAQAEEVKTNVDIKEEIRKESSKTDGGTRKGNADLPKEEQKVNEKGPKIEISPIELKDGEKLAQGIISEVSKISDIERDGKPFKKVNLMMDENKYGLFLDSDDERKLFEEICAVIDIQNKSNPIIMNIIYKERTKGDKVFRDIVRFKQGEAKKLPI